MLGGIWLVAMGVGCRSGYPLHPSLADVPQAMLGAGPDENLGWAVAGGADLDGDGLDDLLVGAPLADLALMVRGPALELDRQSTDTVWQGRFAGAHLAAGGDATKDGLADVLMGLRVDLYDPQQPVVRMFAGDPSGDLAGFRNPALKVSHDASPWGQSQEYRVAWLDDGSFLVGNGDSGSDATGVIWRIDAASGRVELDGDAVARIVGPERGAGVGNQLVTGHADRDGVTDAFTTIRSVEDGQWAVAVIDGTSSGDIVLDGLEPRITSGVMAIRAVLDAGADVTGDGLDDLLVAIDVADANGHLTFGAALVAGPFDQDRVLDAPVAIFEGTTLEDGYVFEARFVGDMNGDGEGDIAVGAPGSPSTESGGTVALFLGPFEGSRSLEDADVVWTGAASGAGAGRALAAAGDVDGDGRADLLIGSPWLTVSEHQEGAVYLIPGGSLPRR